MPWVVPAVRGNGVHRLVVGVTVLRLSIVVFIFIFIFIFVFIFVFIVFNEGHDCHPRVDSGLKKGGACFSCLHRWQSRYRDEHSHTQGCDQPEKKWTDHRNGSAGF